MMAVTTYNGFELKPNQKLLLEFTEDNSLIDGIVGRMVYFLDEETARYYGYGREGDADTLEIHGINEGDDVDIANTLGFMIDGGEHTYPDKVSELAADENPITTDGLPRVQWGDLKAGMTVVFAYDGGIAEATLSEEDAEIAEEDLEFYPFSLTVREDSTKLYLKAVA